MSQDSGLLIRLTNEMRDRIQKPPGVILLNYALEPQFVDSTAKFLFAHLPHPPDQAIIDVGSPPGALHLPPTLLAFAKDLQRLVSEPDSGADKNPSFLSQIIPCVHTIFHLHGWGFPSEDQAPYFLVHLQAIPKPYRPTISFTELTRREHDTFHLFIQGYRDCEIAELLGIRLNTAKHHLKAIRRKIDIKTQTTIPPLLTPPIS